MQYGGGRVNGARLDHDDQFVTPAVHTRTAMLPDSSAEQGLTTPEVPTVSMAPLHPAMSGAQAMKSVSSSKPAIFASGSKPAGAGLFKKPMMGGGKQKFRLDMPAPDENEAKTKEFHRDPRDG